MDWFQNLKQTLSNAPSVLSNSWVGRTIKEIGGGLSGDLRRENQELERAAALQQQEYAANSAQKAMDFTAQQNDLAYARQKELRGTAYQDTVKDLKAAGLNPILAMNNGATATPSVSAGSGVSAEGQKAEVDTASQIFNVLGAVVAGITAADKIKIMAKPKRKIGFGD